MSAYIATIKQSMITRPLCWILASVLLLFSIHLFSGVEPFYVGDLFMYINIAQNLMNDGVLYRDAIDTKSIGYLLLFSILYAPYALIFDTMKYFFVYQALILSLLYFGIGYLIYKIVVRVYDEFLAVLSALFAIVMLTMIPQSYFINQPQVGMFFHLLYIYIVLLLWGKGLKSYFVYGIMLGFLMSVSSPYILLTLSIPVFALYSAQGNKLIDFILKSSTAFLGFLAGLLPFVIYLAVNNAFADWWQWNVLFATGPYSVGFNNGEVAYISLFQASNNFLVKILLGMISMLGGFIILTLYTLDSVVHAVMVWVLFIAWICYIFSKKIKIKTEEFLILIASVFGILTRLTLIRPYMSYNIYIFPLLCMSLPFLMTRMTKFKKVFLIFFVIASLSAFAHITYKVTNAHRFEALKPQMEQEGGGNYHAFIQYFPRHLKFDKGLVEIIKKNPDKMPTFMSDNGWWLNSFSYNTKWKSLFYNVYARDEFYQKIMELQPEALILTEGHQQETLNRSSYKEYIDSHYTQSPLSKILFIKNDNYNEWIF